MPLTPGQTLTSYEIVARLGKGGGVPGQRYLARARGCNQGFADGKMVEQWTVADIVSVRQTLGTLDAPVDDSALEQ